MDIKISDHTTIYINDNNGNKSVGILIDINVNDYLDRNDVVATH